MQHWIIAAIAACLPPFVAGAPYTLPDLPGFLEGFAQLSGHSRRSRATGAPALTYVKHLLIYFGYPAALLAIAGFVLAVVRIVKARAGPGGRFCLVIPIAHFYMISGQQLVFGRYLLPIVPMLCLLAADAVVSGVSLLRRYEIPRGRGRR